MGQILALDFGGTKLTAAVVDTAVYQTGDLTWGAHRRLYTPPEAEAGFELARMVALGQGVLAGGQAAAVGVSFGGPADYRTGTVRLSHHVTGWEGTPLQARLESIFAAPVRIDNDANVAALGEWRFGAGRDLADLLYITVSTGVGGGWILGGRPYRGQAGMAGEIGHTVVDPKGPLCLCGKRGCVERLASGPYMAADLAAASGQEGQTGETVARLAAAGEKTAVRILERGAWALGAGIGNAANLMSPQRVLLGGGVTKAGRRWWQVVRQTAQAAVLPQIAVEIEPAALGDDGPLWGAVALVEELVPDLPAPA